MVPTCSFTTTFSVPITARQLQKTSWKCSWKALYASCFTLRRTTPIQPTFAIIANLAPIHSIPNYSSNFSPEQREQLSTVPTQRAKGIKGIYLSKHEPRPRPLNHHTERLRHRNLSSFPGSVILELTLPKTRIRKRAEPLSQLASQMGCVSCS